MMQPIDDVERQSAAEREAKRAKKVRRNYHIAIGTLTVIASGLVAGMIILGAIHARQAEDCGLTSPSDLRNTTAAPQASAVVPPSKRLPIVVVPISARTTPIYPITNSTHGPSPSSGVGQCEPGSVWGGQELDDLNHGYMALMQKALSVSPPGTAGEIRDYYHTSLQSVFRCGESMDVGQLELVDACKSGYVVDGENIECDEGGSYGNSTSASA